MNLLEHLFNKVEKDKTHYLTIIENGIYSISDKCNQVNKNAEILEEKIKTYNNGVGIPAIKIYKGIATWDDNQQLNESRENSNIDFIISIESVDEMNKKLRKQLVNLAETFKNEKGESKRNKRILNNENYNSHKKKQLIKAIQEQDCDYLYRILSKGRFYTEKNQDNFPGNLRGRMAELLLQDYIKNNIGDMDSFFNVIFDQPLMRINGEKHLFGVGSEIDFLLVHKEKNALKKFLLNINNQKYAKVICKYLKN